MAVVVDGSAYPYSKPGTYAASLQVADNRGLISATSNTVTITAAAPPAKATMISPTPGSTLAGSSQTFTWTTGSGVSSYLLWVGTKVGGNDIYNPTLPTAATSATVLNIPSHGKTVYVRLWSYINGVRQYNDYTYKEAAH